MNEVIRPLLVALTCSAGCVIPQTDDPADTDDAATETGTMPPPVAFEHCDPGDPMSHAGMSMGSFGDVDGTAEVPTDALDFPAGGYVTASFFAGEARGGIAVSGDDELTNTVEGEYEATVTIGLLAAPGASYLIEGVQQASAPEYPVSWNLEWEAHPIPDCWEPNNSPEEASVIALDHPVSGYVNAALTADAVVLDDFYDYYEVQLESAGTLEVRMTAVPDDALIRVSVFDEAGESVGGPLGAEDMGDVYSGTVTIPAAGVYRILVDPFIKPILDIPDGDPVPSSWTEPYRFELSFEPD